MQNFIKQLIDLGISSGEINEEIDSKEVSSIIFAMFIEDIVPWMVSIDLNLFDLSSSHLNYIWENIIN
ncbi:hypothetical protein ALNOE001_08360 [Candidatus Methanobinarius endosymbioticus]|uniref:Uncharacterized protein n=1 Tax=Candidatus Methanobinarius endosymbioticus TaxID=2006182 RepID=A0A366MBF2_9EURY|nr:hypothetical protein ALNOE001_08360 [Candidatus Methanobinarius endosymbioticus]